MDREEFVEAIKDEIRSTGGSRQCSRKGWTDKPLPVLDPILESIRSRILIQAYCLHADIDRYTLGCLDCGATRLEIQQQEVK